jgi:hypothetical protein
MRESRIGGRIAAAWVLAGIVMIVGCVQRQTTRVEVMTGELEAPADLRSATNLPAQFTIITPAASAGNCPPELRDPGLNTILRLHRAVYRPVADTTAHRAVGDYTVQPMGRYGEIEGEGLRVDCVRLRPIGVVLL